MCVCVCVCVCVSLYVCLCAYVCVCLCFNLCVVYFIPCFFLGGSGNFGSTHKGEMETPGKCITLPQSMIINTIKKRKKDEKKEKK